MTIPVFPWAARRMGSLGAACLMASLALGQVPQSDTPTETADPPVLDDFTTRQVVAERPVLPYQPVREADILFEKRIWRVIEVREKMNLPFIYPEAPLFTVLAEAALSGQLQAYTDDRFNDPMTLAALQDQLVDRDTVMVFNLDTQMDEAKLVTNEIDPTAIRRFRVKEAWFFDTNTGQLRVRILGIAPMMDVVDQNGDFKYERPLFWIHYPTARPFLARQKVYAPGGNLSATMTWEDIFEMRHFASMVYKESNPYDRRIQDYLQGEDIVYESAKINDELFNREHDLWSW